MNHVMNIIPTTFNEHAISYTIVGGRNFERKENDIGAIVMSRGGWYNFSSIIKSLLDIGCTSIISVELPNKYIDLENMINEYPFVKFLLLPPDALTIGDSINIAISELKTDYAIVLWNDQSILDSNHLSKAIEEAKKMNKMCLSPVAITKTNDMVSVQMLPILKNGHFSTEAIPIIQNNTRSIYPFDFTGIYNCKKFIDFGGFDYTLTNSYWQNLDFGFRTFLWGEEIAINTHFKVKYLSNIPIEDTSHDDSYTRFYIKNLRPTVANGKAYMKFDVFFSYMKGMGFNPFMAYNYFKVGYDWVKKNQKRFVTPPYELIKNWREI
ncbi:MAG: hypothetical protein ACTTJ6_07430 [Treponema sp.]